MIDNRFDIILCTYDGNNIKLYSAVNAPIFDIMIDGCA